MLKRVSGRRTYGEKRGKAARTTAGTRRAALWVNEEETMALLSLLLSASPTTWTSEEITAHLLCRVVHLDHTLAGTAKRAGRHGYDQMLDCAG